MNPIIINCIDIVGPADIEPLLVMATSSSDEPYDKCFILARNLNLVTEIDKEDNTPIRRKLINRLNLPFLGIITYSTQFKRYQVYQVTNEGVSLADDELDTKALASIDLDRLLNKYSSESFLRGGDQYHFTTPSHNHTDAFFRLGDSIKNKDDLDRVAFWLLQVIDHSDYIFIDSWSIAALPLRAMQILGKTTVFDALPAHPARKHGDCRSVICATTPALKSSTNPLLIVSVDSSGSLIRTFREIFSAAYPLKKLTVVSVYSFNGGDEAICKINAEVKRFNFDECELCKKNSKPIEIHASAYYVKSLTDSGITLCKTIASTGKPFFEKYHDHLDSIISFHKGDHFKGRKHYAYYVDYSKLSGIDAFSGALNQKLRSLLTSASLVLTFCDDENLKKEVNSLGAKCIYLKEVESVLEGDTIGAFAASDKVVIYDPVVINGKPFERLNNLIRETPELDQEVRDITFLSGLYRPASGNAEKRLKNCVAYPDRDGVKRSLQHIETLVLPDYNQFDCPWCLEFNSINGSVKKGIKNSGHFYERLTKLSNIQDGLSGKDALFHIDPRTESITLGGGSYLAPEKTGISGVVLAVASSLQLMRSHDDETKRLSPGFPYTQVLGAKNFENYSEGLIRSAIIRNASAIEYGVIQKEETLAVLLPALEDPQQGSLLSEYLIAVICGKLPPFTTLSDSINSQLAELRAQSPKLMALTLAKGYV
ncbi:hypothetical protein LOY42_13685 [Pseudomonas sp. B21-023]|uniref:hypothetical protein n=1 Tax=unclassified Pseudomonas TaxID=196821 RepID=UPI001553A878|nr:MULTISPECIES: hypothetical protein [unclassified Pseudomonas]NQD78197.1 hypothetical protein [Pseudomonas sp. CM27]UVM14358.1 hypothetical protein LOY42_13685 [Pseudomonas sp. B21-023]